MRWQEKIIKTEEALRILGMGREVADVLTVEAKRLRSRQKHFYMPESKMLEDLLATLHTVKALAEQYTDSPKDEEDAHAVSWGF